MKKKKKNVSKMFSVDLEVSAVWKLSLDRDQELDQKQDRDQEQDQKQDQKQDWNFVHFESVEIILLCQYTVPM